MTSFRRILVIATEWGMHLGRYLALALGLFIVPAAYAQGDDVSGRARSVATDLSKNTQLKEMIARQPAARIDLTRINRDALVRPATPDVAETSPATVVPLQPGEARYVKVDAAAERQLSDMVRRDTGVADRSAMAVLPGVVETLDRNAKTVVLKAVAFPRSPLRYNETDGAFEGRVSVGVVEVASAGGGGSKTLAAPITFQVVGPVSASPDPVQVDRTAPPYRDVMIMAGTPAGGFAVSIVSNVAPEGEPLQLQVQPKLQVSASPQQLQGWGLETADIVVRTQGGQPAGSSRIQLATNLGRLSGHVLPLDNSGMATLSIRSESMGNALIEASGPGFDGGTARVAFVFPWRFLIAGLLGGLIGSVLRKSGGATLSKRLGLGLACAAVVLGLYLLGVNVTGFALPSQGGEVLVFVVAALGAFLGTRLLTPAQPG